MPLADDLVSRLRYNGGMKLRTAILLSCCHLVLGCLAPGCRRATKTTAVATNVSVMEARSLHVPSAPPVGPLFRKLAVADSGIDLVYEFPPEANSDMLSDQSSGTGVCVGDVDGDGLPDVYLTNYDRGNRLYRNLGGMRFKDMTQAAGVSGEGRWCAGPAFVDIDNDGDLDLHVCVYAGNNLLYINDGQGRFTEQAQQFGLDANAASVMMTFADYDLDGDLDAYLVTHRLVTEGDKHELPKDSQVAIQNGVVQVDPKRGVRVAPGYQDYFAVMPKGKPGRMALVIAGQEDTLFRNERGKFRPVNREAGIAGHGIGLSAIWWDFNDDGHPDLYVSNDYKGADQLYRNNGDGTFTDVVDDLCPHVPWYSMGADAGDVNNDGWTDLFASDMSGTSHYKQKVAMGDMTDDAWFLDLARPPQYMRNTMFLNTGGSRMLEVAKMAGVSSTDWTWSPKFGDLDNDGWLDLFIANGMSRDFMNSDLHAGGSRGGARWKDQAVLREKNLAFRNQDGLHFQDVSAAWGLDELSASYGAALSDLDRDGDLDLITTNFDGPVLVYENKSIGNRLLVQLKGTSSNRAGLGSKLELRTSEGKQTRLLTNSQGFMSSNEALAHFGLGESTPESLTVHWPSGYVQTLNDLRPNQFVMVTEPSQGRKSATPIARLARAFTPSTEFDRFRHREQVYDDFADQPLLPSKLSQRGPGIACGDVDDDGGDDFYLGAAKGTSGTLVLSNGKRIQFPSDDRQYEDMGALLFDADSDGDLDLYVVSGGVETEPDSAALQDRLYLNADGKFTRAVDRLPNTRESGSCVCAADYDLDGDLDLFIGGYSVPGRYPESSRSYLLRNENGIFSDATQEVASELTTARLVTAAIWSDVDGDRRMDLLVTQEWGTVDVYLQRNGQLQKSEHTGLDHRTGWWNGIAGGDVDGDGDIDFVVTNQGLNTKYKASVEHPTRLYRGDFDGSGNLQLVEAKYEQGILLPERGKSCSTAAIPILGERFPTYKAFAVAGLEEIYTAESLAEAEELLANTLESGVLINDGTGNFSFRPLPPLAQIAPADGVVLSHFDDDGSLDLVLAQNDFSPQRETGRMDGGVSLLLLGVGDGTFQSVWPSHSGISVTADAQGVLITDLDDDQRPDLIFGVNDAAWQSYRSNQDKPALAVQLQGPVGNPSGVGARVELVTKQGRTLTQEVYAGSGYLTQSSATLFFGMHPTQVDFVRVLWPNGSQSETRQISSLTTMQKD